MSDWRLSKRVSEQASKQLLAISGGLFIYLFTQHLQAFGQNTLANPKLEICFTLLHEKSMVTYCYYCLYLAKGK